MPAKTFTMLLLCASFSAAAHAAVLIEDFEQGGGAGFDPAFNHFLHAVGDPGSPGSWELGSSGGDHVLWLFPATDEITFNLGPADEVTFARVTMYDGCGIGCSSVEFVGTGGSMTFWNQSVGVEELYDTAGLGLGEITRIVLTSFEGYFDDVWIETGPECPADVDGDGMVGFADLLLVLSAWGSCPGCPEDINGDGAVDFNDLLAVLATWGPCS